LDIGVFRTKRLRRLCKSTRLCWPRATFPTVAGGFRFASFYGNCGTKFPKIDRERDNQLLSYSDVITGDLLETAFPIFRQLLPIQQAQIRLSGNQCVPIYLG
jgi:hypothetical protein